MARPIKIERKGIQEEPILKFEDNSYHDNGCPAQHIFQEMKREHSAV